jgi:hypothetical protein
MGKSSLIMYLSRFSWILPHQGACHTEIDTHVTAWYGLAEKIDHHKAKYPS